MVEFLLEIGVDYQEDNTQFIISPVCKIVNIKIHNFNLRIWGDPIFEKEFNPQLLSARIDTLIPFLTKSIKGHYYYCIQELSESSVYIGCSLFGILPLYYSDHNQHLYISSSTTIISNHLNLNKRDNRFILENILFNYPLFNRTAFENISLLSTNSYLKWKDLRLSVHNHTNILDYFHNQNTEQKYKIDELANLFLERSKQYFPLNKYIHAVTGGFDGRTLLGCALYHNMDFETYCFGSNDSIDISISKEISSSLGIEHNQFTLDEAYIKSESLNNGIEFINNASGTASFARAHYLYSAKELSKKTNIIVTGNFGSELFRVAHITGSVISRNLYELFNSKNLQEAYNLLTLSPENKWLNSSELSAEWESLYEDLKSLPCFDPNFRDLSQNEQFYLFVFNEVFRKYFGAEMINQYKYLVNRTPYIDFDFIREFFKSNLAGVHGNFFEHSPLKRYKGQLLYSRIIQNADKELSNIYLDKGYRPSDIMSLSGLFRIINAQIQKNIIKNPSIPKDPFSVKKSIIFNKEKLLSFSTNNPAINTELLAKNFASNKFHGNSYIALSQSIFSNK